MVLCAISLSFLYLLFCIVGKKLNYRLSITTMYYMKEALRDRTGMEEFREDIRNRGLWKALVREYYICRLLYLGWRAEKNFRTGKTFKELP